MGPDEVFKFKKAIDLGFLDFRELEARREVCEREVELNRRLAPDVYLGVRPVFETNAGGRRLTGDGTPVDWAVHMRRMPDDIRADHRLARGELGHEQLESIAGTLARFHDRCPQAPADAGFSAVQTNVRENFAQCYECPLDSQRTRRLRELEDYQASFLVHHRERFESRQKCGYVRDGHGDLRLEHLYLDPDAVRVLDCIEFNDRFRFADTCADIAFLSMDLRHHQRNDLAERFLALYAREANDYGLYDFVDFYESYRAHVRAKVALLVARDAPTDSGQRDSALTKADAYLQLIESTRRKGRGPGMVVAVGGCIGAGKSTIARCIAERLSAPIIDSDRTRKFLAGVRPTTSVADDPWTGHYSSERTDAVYETVCERACAVLRSGRAVVLDATFRTRAQRARAVELARAHDVALHFIECHAPEEVCRQRLAARERGTSISDGRLELLDEFQRQWQAVDELPEGVHFRLDTSDDLAKNLERLDFLL